MCGCRKLVLNVTGECGTSSGRNGARLRGRISDPRTGRGDASTPSEFSAVRRSVVGATGTDEAGKVPGGKSEREDRGSAKTLTLTAEDGRVRSSGTVHREGGGPERGPDIFAARGPPGGLPLRAVSEFECDDDGNC